MQLLIASASPFVRKVRVLIREAGQTAAVTETPVSTTPLVSDPAVVAANPTGKIPALIRDDGRALYDSRVITRYLDDRFQAGLYPADRLWDVLVLESTADAIMDAAVLMTYEARFRSPDMQSPDWLAGQWAKVSRALADLERNHAGLLAQPLDMGQIALGCALGYLDLRHDARAWRQGHAALAAWFAGFAQRPAMLATAP
jgi:glutathione S-transferase